MNKLPGGYCLATSIKTFDSSFLRSLTARRLRRLAAVTHRQQLLTCLFLGQIIEWDLLGAFNVPRTIYFTIYREISITIHSNIC
jgi:hypothetical protein